jgi:AraC family cel operon transcriptional repressor
MAVVPIELHGRRLRVYESKHREGYAFMPHRHEVHQILYAINGAGELMLDGNQVAFAEDQVAVILPHTIHSVQAEKSLTLIVLAFRVEEPSSVLTPSFFETYFPRSLLIDLERGASTELQHVFRKLLFLQSKEHHLNDLAAYVQLCELLILLAKQRDDLLRNQLPGMAQRIKLYIERNYYQIQFARDIATLHHMSVRYMDNMFKEHYGKTPIQYLTEVRIARAQTLLLDTKYEIISICFEVGYENLSTFYRSFKWITGMTPSQYRNRMQTNL